MDAAQIKTAIAIAPVPAIATVIQIKNPAAKTYADLAEKTTIPVVFFY